MTTQFSLANLHDRLSMRLDREAGMRALDETVEKYGRIGGKPFSFFEHEFQREIIKDTSSRLSIRKCSQVGLSELMVQKLLAMAASMKHVRIIMTLPTKEMAISFSKDRVDGAIEQSDFYLGLTTPAMNSASQKKLGSCTIYLTGSFGANSAISVPAECVICDEVDFSNQVVLGKLNSRLRHASLVDEHGQRGIRYMFSTPTVSGYGIDLEFSKGDQRYYQVKCEGCNHWQVPGLKNFRIPGWDDDMEKFNRDDAARLTENLGQTKMHCEKCDRDLLPSLLKPELRQWVPMFENRIERSYQVFPWDVPAYNTPPAIMRQMTDYPLKSDFYNFVLGLPFTDADNSFMVDELHKTAVRVVDPVRYLAGTVMSYTVMGLDIGKTCHMVIGTPVGKKLHIMHAEAIENTRANPALPQVLDRFDWFKCVQAVVDSGPDISLANGLTSGREDILAAVYVRELKGPKIFEVKNTEPVVNIDRTKSLSFLLAKHNSGDILYPRSEITDEIFDHLDTTKKVRRQNSDGTFTELFTKTDKNDHYVHALHYCLVAAEIKFGMGAADVRDYAPVSVGVASVGSKSQAAAEEEEKNRLRRLLVW